MAHDKRGAGKWRNDISEMDGICILFGDSYKCLFIKEELIIRSMFYFKKLQLVEIRTTVVWGDIGV